MPPKVQKIYLPEAPPVQQSEPRGNQPIHAKAGNEKTSPSDQKQSQEQPPLAQRPAQTAPENKWCDGPESIGMADCETMTPLRESSVKQNKPSNAGPDFLNSSGASKPSKAPSGGMGWVVLLMICVLAVLWIAFGVSSRPQTNDQAALRPPNYENQSNISISQPSPPLSTPKLGEMAKTAQPSFESSQPVIAGSSVSSSVPFTNPVAISTKVTSSTPAPAFPSPIELKTPQSSTAEKPIDRGISGYPGAIRRLRVIRVSLGDTLSLRNEPDSQSKKIAKIPYNASDVFLLGTFKQNGKDLWFPVAWNGIRGWVNGSYVDYQ